MSDTLRYANEVFFKLSPGWHLIKQYHVLNRLIPSGLLKMLKNLSGKNPQ